MLVVIAGLVFSVFGSVIILVHTTLYVGLFIASRKASRLRKRRDGGELSVAVVVPARDEEQLLPFLLQSLENQTRQDFHIRLINDRSTDATLRIMEEFASRLAGRVSVVSLEGEPRIASPKLNALVEGAGDIDSDILLFTDADCRVPPTWVEEVPRCFADGRVGLVIAPIETRRGAGLLSLYHTFEHVFKASYNAACTGIGLPTGGFGNNLAVRRSVLEEVGGFESVDVTATEDAALIARIRARTKWAVRALFSRSVTVTTEPQKSLADLTRQEVRWHTGGIFSKDFASRFNYRFLMFYLLASVLILPFGLIHPVFALPAAVSFGTMSTISVIGGWVTRQPIGRYWLPLPLYVILTMVYNSFLTVRAVLKPKLTWKGTDLQGVR